MSVQIVGRSPRQSGREGRPRSVVAMAAYRAGERLQDERSGRVADYSQRRGVVHSEIRAPDGSAEWLRDRQKLWNGVEAAERRRDAQLAREINLALPHEMDDAGRLTLVRGFVDAEFVSRGMVADIAIHQPVPEKGDDPRNHHAHVMLTLRQATAEGLRGVKTREWNSDALLQGWRAAWQEHQNRALERAGRRERVDHRTLVAQRTEARQRGEHARAAELDRRPEIHAGPQARQARKRGFELRSHEREQATARARGGRWTSAKERAKRVRVIDYPRIDRGNRSEYVARLLEARISRGARLLLRRERQAARFRDRFVHYEKRQRRDQGARNSDHWQQRAGQANGLARLIDQMIRGLMRSLEQDRGRQRSLIRERDIARVFDRGRERGRTY